MGKCIARQVSFRGRYHAFELERVWLSGWWRLVQVSHASTATAAPGFEFRVSFSSWPAMGFMSCCQKLEV